MAEVKLHPCAVCGEQYIKYVGNHNWQCRGCGLTGPNADKHGVQWNRIQELLMYDQGVPFDEMPKQRIIRNI